MSAPDLAALRDRAGDLADCAADLLRELDALKADVEALDEDEPGPVAEAFWALDRALRHARLLDGPADTAYRALRRLATREAA